MLAHDSNRRFPLALQRLGLSPDEVRRIAETERPPTPDEIRRAASRHVRKGHSGCKGLPGYVVDAMYSDYLRLKSLRKCGALHGRTRQTMYDIFVSHAKPLIARLFFRKVIYKLQAYTPDKDGYLRQTDGKREALHHVIWTELNGSIPAGCQISFRNGNTRDFAAENLACLPVATALAKCRNRDDQTRPPAELSGRRPRPARKYPIPPPGKVLRVDPVPLEPEWRKRRAS